MKAPGRPLSVFQRAYDQHVDYVWSTLRAHGVDGADIDDLTQEVFLQLYRRWSALDTERSLRPWLFGVCRNLVRSHRRYRSVRLRLDPMVLDDAPLADGVSAVERRQAWRLFAECLARLPEPQQEVFLLAELQQLSRREVAQALQLSPNTVGSRLRLAREALDRQFLRLRARDERIPATNQIVQASRSALRPTSEERSSTWRCLVATVGTPSLLPLGSASAKLLGTGWLGALRWSVPMWARGGILVGASLAGGLSIVAVASEAQENPMVERSDRITPTSKQGPLVRAPEHHPEPMARGSYGSGDESSFPTLENHTTPKPKPKPSTRTPESNVSPKASIPRDESPRTLPKGHNAVKPNPSMRTSEADGATRDTTSSDDLLLEIEWVGRAQSAFKHGNWRQALNVCEGYASRYPHGRLLVECTWIEVKSRCRLQQTQQAHSRLVQWARRLGKDVEDLRRFVRNDCNFE